MQEQELSLIFLHHHIHEGLKLECDFKISDGFVEFFKRME